MMFLNKFSLTALALGVVTTTSLFAAGNDHDGIPEQPGAAAELARESVEQWVERMADTYKIKMTAYYDPSPLLNALRQMPVDRQEWVERMAGIYITPEMDIFNRPSLLGALSQTPVDCQEWVERMAETYITPGMDGSVRSSFLRALRKTPVDCQEWVERMAETYIMPEMDANARSYLLCVLGETPVDCQEWVERMVQTYIMPEMNINDRLGLISSFGTMRAPAHAWFEHLMTFLEGDHMDAQHIVSRVNVLSGLSRSLYTPDLLEQGRIRLVESVNQVRQEGPLTRRMLSTITDRVRDQLTQEAQVNANAARPMGRATEVHFASAVKVPLEEDGGRQVPLYKAVEAQLRHLKIEHEMKLEEAVSCIQDWVSQYADEKDKDQYHRVVTKGYGDGLNPEYNREITPLLRYLVPYMQTLNPTVQSAWLLPALEESATAYDHGDTVSCAKGIQERLTVVGLDVEGMDPVLRSLSKFARDFLYISIPTTNGADAWVKTAVRHLTGEERALLLGDEKPKEDAFRDMFQRVLSVAISKSGLLPIHAQVLLKNEHIQTAFGYSLEMHYDYDEHYKNLQDEARRFETPEERRDLMARAAEKRLAKSAPAGEDDHPL